MGTLGATDAICQGSHIPTATFLLPAPGGHPSTRQGTGGERPEEDIEIIKELEYLSYEESARL